MTNPTTKVLLLLLTLATMTAAASAQTQRTFYDASGNVVGRSATDSSGTVTNYDARGNNTTTFYDAGGNVVGIVTTQMALTTCR